MENEDPIAAPRPPAAGGFAAVKEAMRVGLVEMGLRRSATTLLKVNQKEGFDCPSCAWPDRDDNRELFAFCENGAKAVASEATTARVTPEFFANHSVAEIAAHDDCWLEKQGRITHPMVLRAGASHYQPISWDDAFTFVAAELNALASPDEAVFYTSGRSSNEAAFLYQLFVRQFGTNNLPDCSNMCHESSSLGLAESIGIGKATVSLDDFGAADVIFIIGQNPGTNHPRMLGALQAAVRNGCKIVSINPLPELGLERFQHPQEPFGLLGRGTPIACLHLPVRINGDIAALKGIMKMMLEEDSRRGGVIDREFIDQRTEGFDAFEKDLKNESWDAILDQSGLTPEQLREAAWIACKSERMIICWAMGITQHRNGVANVQTIVNFGLLRGQIGRTGAGLCPVRGHSNVQGDRTVGITEKLSARFGAALEREFYFTPPRKDGFDTVRAIQAMHSGQAKVLFALGGNLFSAAPDSEFTATALRRCNLTAHVSTKLNRSHLVTGKQALILPCRGRTERDIQASGEQFVSVEDTMGVVHASRGVLEPASAELMSEVAIVANTAAATLKGRAITSDISPSPGTLGEGGGEGLPARGIGSADEERPSPFPSPRVPGEGTRESPVQCDRPARKGGTSVPWLEFAGNYDLVRDAIERTIPGFEDYNRRVRVPGGFYLPNGPRKGEFTTSSGKARFKAHPIPLHQIAADQWMLTTIRSHDQFNTTIYGLDDRYRGVQNGRHVVFLNQQDIHDAGLAAGDWVDLISSVEGRERRASRFKVMAYPIPRRCAAAYFPEANVLVPVDYSAAESNQPASKSVPIRIEKHLA